MKAIKQYIKKIPRLTTEQMIEVDRLMIEEYGIQLIQMMENAGRCLAIVAVQKFLRKKLNTKTVIILAGTGGNGGGALVAARRLHNWGANVSVYLMANEDKMTPIPLKQLQILKNMGVSIQNGEALVTFKKADLIIDGLIGYSIKGNPRGMAKNMIDWANRQTNIPILSLDTPSGIDLTTGTIHEPTVKASATLTLALPKKGLFVNDVLSFRGALYLGDISVPPNLYAATGINLKVNPRIFAKSDVLLLSQKSDF